MIELLVGATLVWAIITALGHASWVVTVALVRVIFAQSTGSAR